MGILIVILLAAVWAGILLPGAVRAHRTGSPLNTVDRFERSMVMLAPTRSLPGRHVLVFGQPSALAGSRRSRMLRRRRTTVAALAAAVPVTLLAAVVFGGVLWAAFVLSLLLLAAYVGVLVHLRVVAEEQRATVRRLPVEPTHVHVVTPHPPRHPVHRRAG